MSFAGRTKLDPAAWLKENQRLTTPKNGPWAAEEARHYGEAVDKAANLYDGFGNVVGKINPKVQGPVTTNEYNEGSDEDRRRALDSIYDYIKTLITLATGTVALSATFLAKDMPHSKGVWWLISSWIVLGAKINMPNLT
jgi:hypothetical protein